VNNKEPRPMKAIHEIRIRLWEEERTLSPEERMERSKQRMEWFVRENNLEKRVISK
jgi:hypothetical protein